LRSCIFAADQRINDRELWKAAEIPICAPKLLYAVLNAQRSHSGVMHPRTDDPATGKQASQLTPVRIGFGEQHEARRFEPCVDLGERDLKRSGWRENPEMRDDRQELVHARPRNRPCGPALREARHARRGSFVPVDVLPLRIDQDVDIESDHVPRPS